MVRTAEQYEQEAAGAVDQARKFPSQATQHLAFAQVFATLALAAATAERQAPRVVRAAA